MRAPRSYNPIVAELVRRSIVARGGVVRVARPCTGRPQLRVIRGGKQ